MINEISKKFLKKRNYAIAITLDNFGKMSGVESFLWNINNLMENFPKVGLILISTSKSRFLKEVSNHLTQFLYKLFLFLVSPPRLAT